MGRKKKDDFIDNNDQAVVTLDDFVIESKIEAFCRTYKPLSAWTEDCDVFNDSKLRTYFKAVYALMATLLSFIFRSLHFVVSV